MLNARIAETTDFTSLLVCDWIELVDNIALFSEQPNPQESYNHLVVHTIVVEKMRDDSLGSLTPSDFVRRDEKFKQCKALHAKKKSLENSLHEAEGSVASGGAIVARSRQLIDSLADIGVQAVSYKVSELQGYVEESGFKKKITGTDGEHSWKQNLSPNVTETDLVKYVHESGFLDFDFANLKAVTKQSRERIQEIKALAEYFTVSPEIEIEKFVKEVDMGDATLYEGLMLHEIAKLVGEKITKPTDVATAKSRLSAYRKQLELMKGALPFVHGTVLDSATTHTTLKKAAKKKHLESDLAMYRQILTASILALALMREHG